MKHKLYLSLMILLVATLFVGCKNGVAQSPDNDLTVGDFMDEMKDISDFFEENPEMLEDLEDTVETIVKENTSTKNQDELAVSPVVLTPTPEIEDTDITIVKYPGEGEYSTEFKKYRTPMECAEAYIKAVASSDAATILSLLDVPDKSFISTSDIEYALLRSKYAPIYEQLDGKKFFASCENHNVTRQNDTASARVYFGGESFTEEFDEYVYLRFTDDNTWVVQDDIYYMTDKNLRVTSNATAYIDGVEVPDRYFDKKNVEGICVDQYIIPYIGISNKTLELKAENYYISKEFKVEKDKNVSLFAEADEEMREELLTFIENFWNDTYVAYVNGKDVESIQHYISSDMGEDTIESIFKNIEGLRSPTFSNTRIEHAVSQVSSRDDSDTAYKIEYLATDIVNVNFKYRIQYYDTLDKKTHTADLMTYLFIKIEDGQYKVRYIPDMAFFNKQRGDHW